MLKKMKESNFRERIHPWTECKTETSYESNIGYAEAICEMILIPHVYINFTAYF